MNLVQIGKGKAVDPALVTAVDKTHDGSVVHLQSGGKVFTDLTPDEVMKRLGVKKDES
jgi:hypothetical protein